MISSKRSLLERAHKKKKKEKKSAYFPSVAVFPTASFYPPHLARGDHSFSGKSQSPLSPMQAHAVICRQQNRQADRHTHIKNNTSTALRSNLMLKQYDSCHSPFPGKPTEEFSHPDPLDATASAGLLLGN